MNVKLSVKEYSRAKHLQTLGIPLDEEVLDKSQEVSRGLWLGQHLNIPQTIIFDTLSGGTGVIIGLTIESDFDQMIRLAAVRLEIPWCQEIRWLKDPLWIAPAKHFYTVPNSGRPRFERDVVLNHRFGPNSKLFPGDRLDGFLLGVGEEDFPDQIRYSDRALFKAGLSIFDGRNNSYDLELKFLVYRNREHSKRIEAVKEKVMVAASSTARGTLSTSSVGDPREWSSYRWSRSGANINRKNDSIRSRRERLNQLNEEAIAAVSVGG